MTNEDILCKIGAKIRELRISRNLKQSELSEKCGLSSFSISQMENGNNFSVLSLIKVLKEIDGLYLLEPFMKPSEIEPEVLEKFIASLSSKRKRVSRKDQ